VIANRQIRIIRPPSFSPLNLLRELRGLWHYRDLFYTLTVHRIKVRYKQSVLGLAWAILQPLSLMLIYTVIFSVIARVPSEGVPYAMPCLLTQRCCRGRSFRAP
jgi:lipopolysaccharide transport system permease protein